MNFLKQSMGGAVRQGGVLPPQLMGAIQDIKRMQAVCGGNMQAMINQVAAQRPEIGQSGYRSCGGKYRRTPRDGSLHLRLLRNESDNYYRW